MTYTSKEMETITIKRYVFTPVNSPTSTEMPIKSGRCVDLFFKQQGKKSTYVNHHEGLRREVELILDKLENEFDFDENHNWLHQFLLFDFAEAIQYRISSEADLDLLVKRYLQKLLDYLRLDPKRPGTDQYFARLIEDCKKTISKARKNEPKVDRWPENATDFLRAFLFRGLPKTRQSNSTCKVEKPNRLRLNSSGTIEVQSVSSDDWKEVGLGALNRPGDKGFLTDEGTISILIQLAHLPFETPVDIGAGSRNDDTHAEDPESANEDSEPTEREVVADCFKQSLLLAPHIDDLSKDEIRKHIPSREVSSSKIGKLLKKKVVTVRIEPPPEHTSNLTEFAMTSKEMMIGVFYSGQRKHCVFINGEEGTISDPIPEYGQNEERSAETLKKLDINDGFHEVFVVKRIRLGNKQFQKLMKKRKNA